MFSALNDEQLRQLADAAVVRRIPAGKVIFSQGDPGGTCHNLIEGRVKILQTNPDGSQAVLRFIGPGEAFGTVAALMGKPFPADAVAVVDSVEAVWPVQTFRELIRRSPELGLSAGATAGSRLMDLQQRMRELTGERVEQRIARALLRLAEDGRESDQGVEVDFPITRQELAELTGSTLFTVSRILSAWGEAGLTASRRRRIVVCDIHRLKAIAEGSSHG